MKRKPIVAYHDGQPLLLSGDFAELANIPNGYEIKSSAELWDIVKRHSDHMISQIDLLLPVHEQRPESAN